MMMELLGQANGMPFDMVAKLIVALIVALGAGGFAGKKIQEAREVKVSPIPLPVEMVRTLATKEEVEDVEVRLGAHIDEIKTAIGEERRVSREAQGKTHRRIDKISESVAELRGEVRTMNGNIERVLNKS